MVSLLVAAAIATAPAPLLTPAAALPDADPAIFVVEDQDTTIYLFGTFHALDGKTDWFNDHVKAAFDRSNELVLETLIPEFPAAPRAVQRFSGPAMSVAPSGSLLGTTRMAINAGKAEGMAVGQGADMVLRRAAELAGKHVEGLETLDSQLKMFTRLPGPAISAKGSAGGAGGRDDGAAMRRLSQTMVILQSAWQRGDQSVFVNMLEQLRNAAPVTYKMMFTDRNVRWADWIAARMDKPGAVFVAVGAGHFAGKDSVLVRLAEMGIESERLN